MKKWAPHTFKLLIGVFGVLGTTSWATASFASGHAPPPVITGLIAVGFVSYAAVIVLMFGEHALELRATTGRRGHSRAQILMLVLVAFGGAVLVGALVSSLLDDNRAASRNYTAKRTRTCQASLASGGNVLSARFRRSGTNTMTAPYRQSAVVTGKLTDGAGEPLMHETLCVEEWLIGTGSGALGHTTAPRIRFTHTDAGGAYVYRIPAGPNREAIFNYRDRASQTTYAVRYFANSMPTLHSAPELVRNNGPPLRFWGKLPGPHARGRVVILQAREKSPTHWITFRQVTTDRNGWFRASYRFRKTFEPTTYHFRAIVPRQVGYPWLPGTSQSVSVRVN